MRPHRQMASTCLVVVTSMVTAASSIRAAEPTPMLYARKDTWTETMLAVRETPYTWHSTTLTGLMSSLSRSRSSWVGWDGRCDVSCRRTTRVDDPDATLYWSLGRDIVWPARYWLAVPAVFQNGVWQAEVPSRFAALERWAFMNVRSDKGRTASSLPTLTAGLNPRETAGGWWPRGQLWDVEAGPGAWRPVGPNRHSGVAPAQVAKADAGGISIAPDPQRKNGSHWSPAASHWPAARPDRGPGCESTWMQVHSRARSL